MRQIRFTFVNNGSLFVFNTDKMTRHPHADRGATMLQVHAILTLEALEAGEGDNVALIDASGRALDAVQLAQCAATGKLPVEQAA